MKNSYKVIVKTNQGAEKSTTYDVPEPSVRGGGLKIKAVPGARYQLIDNATGQGPDNIRVKRVGKDLHLSYEGRENDDVVITDYYEHTVPGFSAVIGETNPGVYHPYIPESGETAALMGNLPDGATQVGMALGGEPVAGAGAAVGTLVAAAGFSPLWALPLALLGAGGGGGTAAAAVVSGPKITQAKLHQDDDTGISNTDNITGDNMPRIVVEADAGATVSVKINGKEYPGKEVSAGRYEVPVTDALPDGLRTFDVIAKNSAGGTTTFSGTQFVVDTSSANNYVAPDQTKPTTDPNTSAKVDITSITTDSGSGIYANDFITNDKTLTYSGTVTGFTANGDKVKVELLAADGTTVIETAYVDVTGASSTTPGAGLWSWTRSANHEDGQYTLRATIVDSSGNRTNKTEPTNGTGGGQDQQIVIIDTDGGKNQPDGSVNPNKGIAVTIKSITTDTGSDANDFYTSDNTLDFTGTVGSFTNNGDMVELFLRDSSGKVLASEYVLPEGAQWNWKLTTSMPKLVLADGKYTITAQVVDKAGNPVSSPSPASQIVYVDTDGFKNQPDGSTDPNAVANTSIKIGSIDDGRTDTTAANSSKDTGVDKSDFVTSDNTLVFQGQTTNFDASKGGMVHLQVINSNNYAEVDQYLSPTNGKWSFDNQGKVLSDGKYTIKSDIVDKAGNTVTYSGLSKTDTHSLTIKTSPDSNSANKDATVDVTGITTDSGFSATDFITNDKSLTYSGTVTGFTANDDNVLLELIEGNVVSGKSVATTYVVPGNDGKWAWAYQHEVDGIYNVRATIVDIYGNRVNPKGGGQDVQEVKLDSTPANNSNIKFGISITSLNQDSGSSNSDFLTNVRQLSFSGKIEKYAADFNSKVLVQIVDINGQVMSVATTTVNSSGVWTFDNTSQSLGGDGISAQYILKASIMDVAGNILKSTDHSFVIDRKAPSFKLTSENQDQSIYVGLKFTASENGYFVFNENSQSVGANSLTLSQSRYYNAGEFKLNFMDLAGNGSMPNDQLPNGSNPSPWDLRNGVSLAYEASSGPSTYSGNEVVGSIGKYYVLAEDVPVYNLADLHANIPEVRDISVHNHIGLSGNGSGNYDVAHTLKLTMGDVLALGVKNSFSTNNSSTSDGRIQMRIDGGSDDTVKLDNIIGDRNYDWTAQSDVTISGNTYDAYVNADLNLEVFIQKQINLYLV